MSSRQVSKLQVAKLQVAKLQVSKLTGNTPQFASSGAPPYTIAHFDNK